MGGLTSLGRFLRKLRIDKGEYLKDMAEELGVTISFLSAVENGNKKMPPEWNRSICDFYHLEGESAMEFYRAVAESEKGAVVKFEDIPDERRAMCVAFARKISTLSEKDIQKIQGVLF